MRKGLTGLAFSGGGIRSATFCLGVLQTLVRHGTFRFVDYLSTVSGGGYLGSCVSSVLNRPGIDESAFASLDAAGDTLAIAHLRNGSNYLSPGGGIEKLRLPMVLLRGILLNLWLIVPSLVLGVFITEVLTELWHVAGAPTPNPILVTVPFLAFALCYPLALRLFRGSFSWKVRNFYEMMLAGLLAFSFLALLLIPILSIVHYCIDNNWEGIILEFLEENALGSGVIQAGIVLGVIVLIALLAHFSRRASAFSRSVLALIIGILGPLVVFGVYLSFCIFFVESPYFPEKVETHFYDSKKKRVYDTKSPFKTHIEFLNEASKRNEDTKPNSAPEPNDALELLEDYKFKSGLGHLIVELNTNKVDLPESAMEFAREALDLNPSTVLASLPELPSPPNSPLISSPLMPNARISADPFSVTSLSDESAWIVNLGQCDQVRIEDAAREYLFLPEKSILTGHAKWWFYATGIAIFVLNFFFFDVNFTSTHGFYRDRLSKCYLFNISEDQTATMRNDSEELSDLSQEKSGAPYHLINTALNLPGSDDPHLRGRMAGFFTLSKHYCGGRHTGYCRTENLEHIDRHFNLGTAMAISAAAAAPNMGTGTRRYFRFIMTLLNVRLGYWLPNPKRIRKTSRLRRLLWPNVGPAYLFKEALGKLDARGSHVNLSDGGHIENLGVYQLLKRRCRLIIAIDAEADPEMTFHGLVTLIRYARIDMGIRIQMDWDNLRPDENGFTRSHWALATIEYGAGSDGEAETGHLLYIKSSLTGDENQYVDAYKSANPTFPHQTTADQYFDETQFEVYRNLGEHASISAFESEEVQALLPS